MMHPITSQSLAKARQRDFLKEAEQRRRVALARQARAGQPTLANRFFRGMGDLRIEARERLQKQHTPQSSGTLGWAEE